VALPTDELGSLSMHCLADSSHFMPEFRRIGDEAYASFGRLNAVFSPMVPAAGKIEDDVLDMCVEIFNGGKEGRCNITSGGTESIYCAMVAMREWAKATRPRVQNPVVVAPYTAHAAFSRAAHYFGFRLRRVAVGLDYRIRPADIEAAICDATIGVIASAPNWPYGFVDPVSDIAGIAKTRGLWCHIDACVGGYLAPFARIAGYPLPPFDFAVPGVCSISADLHKYAYVPKPCSTILWRSEEYQCYHYFIAADWPDGPYLAHSMLGSRPFGPIVAAWAILNSLGERGFVALARDIMESKAALVRGIAKIDGLHPWDNDLSLLVISGEGVDITAVASAMKMKGWALLGNQEPPSIHLTIDPLTPAAIDRFLTDLADATNDVRSGRVAPRDVLAYGLAKEGQLPKWLVRGVALATKLREP
jgi:glutamate/tyrosine decarboxylase-like PLP-dependent enzyme